MKTHVNPIPLKAADTDDETHFVKSAALFTFGFVRSVIDAAAAVPGIVSQAASDIGEAWEESDKAGKR